MVGLIIFLVLYYRKKTERRSTLRDPIGMPVQPPAIQEWSAESGAGGRLGNTAIVESREIGARLGNLDRTECMG